MLMVVGAAPSSAQTFAEVSKVTLMLLPPPLITPVPSRPAHCVEGADAPFPERESIPKMAPVPSPLTEVARTSYSLQMIDILPL
jgi:hypothetical protein